MIVKTTAAQLMQWFLVPLAKISPVSKKSLLEEAEGFEEQRILRLPSLDRVIGKHYFYCTGVDDGDLNLGLLLNWSKFIKSPIYQQYLLGLGLLSDEEQPWFKMVLHVKSVHFIIYQARAYNGRGGIFISPKDGELGFVFEPVENWLHKYKRED